MLGQTKHYQKQYLLVLGSLFAEFISCKHQFQKWPTFIGGCLRENKNYLSDYHLHQTHFIGPYYEHTVSWWYGTRDTAPNSGLPSTDCCGWKLDDDEFVPMTTKQLPDLMQYYVWWYAYVKSTCLTNQCSCWKVGLKCTDLQLFWRIWESSWIEKNPCGWTLTRGIHSLKYASTVWGPHTANNINQIEAV